MHNSLSAIQLYGESAERKSAAADAAGAGAWAEWQAAAALPLAAVPPETPDQAANAPQPQLKERRLVLPLLSLPQQQPPFAHRMPSEAPATSRDSAKQQQEPEKLNDRALHDIDALRRALLDEMGRLTSGDIATPLVGAMAGVCLRGLHFVLTGEGTIAEASEWCVQAVGLGRNAQGIATPTATRVYHSPPDGRAASLPSLTERAA